jgi:hypothetical protein
MPKKDKPFIIKVSYEAVYQARDADDAEETTLIDLKQRLRHVEKIQVEVLPDDDKPCEYGKLNRTCDGTKCKVCEREDWLQAMNEDAAEAKYG